MQRKLETRILTRRRRNQRYPLINLYCTREGYRESRVKAATRANRITATRYREKMYVMLDRDKEIWVVSRLELRHSHPCLAKKAVYYHVASLRITTRLAKTQQDVSSIGKRGWWVFKPEFFRKGCQKLPHKQKINPNFFYAIFVDDANKFRSALWVDARCRTLYEYYGDVVSFDTTYRRNMQGLPFASLVGVNHHGKSTLLGCALLGSENIPSFE
ncbi:hypothetical protein Ahy_A05g025611 [Arachis hypogaea]|uniref:MULE transposase domain-containing protein n=1 Tax=Arachis hypogaea TaxID=3818 RepID=A0A445D930_ARAHY|nr:hypothetical protein Ahy_A05g025611 [Arachis hypogaea]